MIRWTLLACCLVIGACRTVRPPAPTDAHAADSGNRSAIASRPSSPPSGGKSAPLNGGHGGGVSFQGSRDPLPGCERVSGNDKPPCAVTVPASTGSSAQHGETPGSGSLPLPVSASVARHAGTNAVASLALFPGAPVSHHAGSAPAEAIALPVLPAARHGETQVTGALPVPVSASVARHTVTNAVVPLTLFPGSAPPRNAGGVSAETIALPVVPLARHSETPMAGSLSLPVALPARNSATNSSVPLPVAIPRWLADTQAERAWRESELERQARIQKEREEQFQQIRRAFYQFLSVSTNE